MPSNNSQAFFEEAKTAPPKTLEEALSVIASLTVARDNAEKAWARLVVENAELDALKYPIVDVGPDEFTFEAEDTYATIGASEAVKRLNRPLEIIKSAALAATKRDSDYDLFMDRVDGGKTILKLVAVAEAAESIGSGCGSSELSAALLTLNQTTLQVSPLRS